MRLDCRVVPRRKKTRSDSRVVPRRKKDTKTHRRASSVGCRCHRSACNKTRSDSRIVPHGKKVTSTHRRADAKYKVIIVPRAPRRNQTPEYCLDGKRDEHPPLSVRGRLSLSSFRVHQDATGQQGSARDGKNLTNTPRHADTVA
ncbi:hypothetical protein TNCV_4587621 [Trichonephila clavipes]|uniref:Uncharacterized protein n=1 Tax=Trichonephila clavipes TaxID=2585209 RepID=A0A8X6RYR4_TRICX|nr:hypothetical protein TNCV_4587621 [Trichonephila clavipes]